MNKSLLFFAYLFMVLFSKGQTYPSMNISLVSMLHPNTGTVGVGVDGRRYNGCWGWKHPVTNKEYAILGASHGVYFVDISTPSSPSVSAFVSGKGGCTWREIKTYQNYCYVVSDDPSPNTFQIIDMTSLSSTPSTVTLIHNGTSSFERGHTIYIDKDKMYIGSVTYTAGNNPAYSSMDIYSLATPSAPVLLRRLSQDYPFVSTVHDMFVKNDTVFASCGNQGLQIFKYQTSLQTFTLLGSYTNYAGSPYNHSSWITPNNKYLVFCDEVPAGLPIKLVDVQNLQNIQPISTFNPHPNTTPHNPYVINNNFVAVACYQDGLNLYNITAPAAPYLAGYFDTYPQGGANVGNYFGADYRGNWGAYPYLSSGLIIALDMQNGMFLLDPSASYLYNGIDKNNVEKATPELIFYPNPANEKIAVHFNSNDQHLVTIRDINGKVVFEKNIQGQIHEYISTAELPSGTYMITIAGENKITSKKLVVIH